MMPTYTIFLLRLLSVVVGVGTALTVGSSLQDVIGIYAAAAALAGIVAAAPFWVAAIAIELLEEIAIALRQ
jgi:hypothetical protein